MPVTASPYLPPRRAYAGYGSYALLGERVYAITKVYGKDDKRCPPPLSPRHAYCPAGPQASDYVDIARLSHLPSDGSRMR